MVAGGDRWDLASGDVVRARDDLTIENVAVPAGRHGVVQGADSETIRVRFPLIVEGKRRLVTVSVPRSTLWLECRGAEVLRSARLKLDPAEEEWGQLQKDELVSLGARLKTKVRVPPPNRNQGSIVPAGVHGTVVACNEDGRGVVFEVNVTLPDPGSPQGHRFTNLELRREDFEVVDPSLARGTQAVTTAAKRGRR